jgi:hypothetical protein
MATFEFTIITDDEGASSEEMIEQGLSATNTAIEINLLYLQRHPEDACILACGGVLYDAKNSSVLVKNQHISTIPILKKKRLGLCIDIVAADVAIKLHDGTKAWPHIFFRGGGIYHVVTHLNDRHGNVIEYDPSAELQRMGFVVSFQPNCRPRV